jgi:hypothetical protein
MPSTIVLQKNSTTGQEQPPRFEMRAQGVIPAAVADFQVWHASHQLTAQGEVGTEWATAVVHKREGHCVILITTASAL